MSQRQLQGESAMKRPSWSMSCRSPAFDTIKDRISWVGQKIASPTKVVTAASKNFTAGSPMISNDADFSGAADETPAECCGRLKIDAMEEDFFLDVGWGPCRSLTVSPVVSNPEDSNDETDEMWARRYVCERRPLKKRASERAREHHLNSSAMGVLFCHPTAMKRFHTGVRDVQPNGSSYAGGTSNGKCDHSFEEEADAEGSDCGSFSEAKVQFGSGTAFSFTSGDVSAGRAIALEMMEEDEKIRSCVNSQQPNRGRR
ncbi:hypothetical protein DPX39_080009900 [Trypanosoma brucei equiperdum]|uniref:Uncharacterized protein n=1 Tax=Trypanosoma brucei equiperdum TaxID=630700 RepID=A0A3L6L270_9TRYP|nr:hypothetical protein DPX39_080009900 [Trypanosoma brucei equiperdum]